MITFPFPTVAHRFTNGICPLAILFVICWQGFFCQRVVSALARKDSAVFEYRYEGQEPLMVPDTSACFKALR